MIKTKYKCPCCANKTMDEKPPGTYQICEICGWEDDLIQYNNPLTTNGANTKSLSEAQMEYKSKLKKKNDK